MFKRVFCVVMDSVGCGTAPLSYEYDDDGANTIAHIASHCNGIKLPNMEKLGYGNLTDILGVKKVNEYGYYGKMDEASKGKDTLTGHWEFMGVLTSKPFKTFTDTGFPKELIDELEEKTGHKVIGNVAASGTEIIKELGEEHIKTGAMIVYTSSDSVLQIACHETAETFTRTTNRHDYALSPTDVTTLDYLKEAGYDVISVGKISDIFNTRGITEGNKIKSNHNGMEITTEIVKRDFNGLCFVNLVDFDALYGHRRNPEGYKRALEEFDTDLAVLMKELKDDDLLIITADHGNDPTWKGTDHTREYVPLLVYSKSIGKGNLGTRKTFADIGATISDNFGVKLPNLGTSFLKDLK